MSKNMKRIQVTQPNLPEFEGTAHTIIGNRILFVEAMHDQDCSNPCEDQDGFGEIRSLSNRHINNIDYDEAKELLENDADVVPLSYYEHGNCIWMVAGSAGRKNTWNRVPMGRNKVRWSLDS